MEIEKARLTLVTDDSQLKVGLLVELRRCSHDGAGLGRIVRCGRTHRMLLLGVCLDRLAGMAGYLPSVAWFATPLPHKGVVLCTTAAIEARNLYIVETGLDETQTRREGRNLPRDAWQERKRQLAYGPKG